MNTKLRGLLIVHACVSLTRSAVDSRLKRFGVEIPDWSPSGRTSAGSSELFLDYDSAMRLIEELEQVRKISFELALFGDEAFMGERWVYSSTLGLASIQIDQAGNQMLSESKLLTILRTSGDNSLKIERAIRRALLIEWDDEFEDLRELQMSQRRKLPRVG